GNREYGCITFAYVAAGNNELGRYALTWSIAAVDGTAVVAVDRRAHSTTLVGIVGGHPGIDDGIAKRYTIRVADSNGDVQTLFIGLAKIVIPFQRPATILVGTCNRELICVIATDTIDLEPARNTGQNDIAQPLATVGVGDIGGNGGFITV